jgi:outer membrane lipoprotein LolB
LTRLRAAAAAACVALVAACATPPTAVAPVTVRVEPSFTADGRMSARRGNDGVAVSFAWRHTPATDDFDVSTPLGQTVARMRRDASGVRVERPNEAIETYPDWRALTHAVLGVAIPVDGLVSWIQGVPDAGGAAGLERDAQGRASVLRQQGWEIVYSYAGEDPTRPSRLVMSYPGSEAIEVRIVIDRFEPWRMPA